MLALSFALTGCGFSTGLSSAVAAPYKKYAPCTRASSSISRLPRASYGAASPGSCVRSVDPFDIAAWVEAPLISYKERGLSTMVLGCANLVPDAADCQYAGQPGHAATLNLNFNMATYPPTARVQRAVLAFYVENNSSFFRENAQVRARLNAGDQLQSVGNRRAGPSRPSGWITVDITDFAARALNEQRPSVSFEISLPCGRDESELTKVRVLKTEPVLVVEYK
ncbi:MAG: hypothetical protein LBG06_11785 [Deltaproteobacteria bacterium]|nr:hypothetical protein [Deltaproteobacteria bacterium]